MSWKIILTCLPIIVLAQYYPILHPADFTEEKEHLRAKFLKDKRKNNVTATQMKLLQNYAPNNTVLVDDILHYKIEGHPQLNQVIKIEDEFRNMLAMEGFTYIYNRDLVWRTWRKVMFDKTARLVHYKYKNTINCTTNCDTSGYWIIEKKTPRCDLEIFSIDANNVCALNMRYYTLMRVKCSSIRFTELTTTCDNPIVTRWIVQKTFSKKEKMQRFPVGFCGGRDICRIRTVYRITANYVSFQIINSTNHIIFSRIMKEAANYACVTHCGVYDPNTNTVQTEEPLKLDLLSNKRLDKREEINENHSKDIVSRESEMNTRSYIKKKHIMTSKLLVKTNPPPSWKNGSSAILEMISPRHDGKHNHSSSCKNLRKQHEHADDDDDDDDFLENELYLMSQFAE